MKTLVVCHYVPLVTYLVAATLKLKFGRLVNIHIIERVVPNQNHSLSSTWCGVSTVSIGRILHWDTLERLLLAGILRDVLIKVDSIHIHEQGESQNKNNSPIINATESVSGSVFGIFYHPQLVIDRLKQFLANSPNVFFLSSHYHSQGFLSHTLLPPKFLSDLVWVDFDGPGGFQLDGRQEKAQSVTCNARVLINPQRHNSTKFNSQEHMVTFEVLWLPMFRASTGVFSDLMLTHKWTMGVNHSHVRILNSNLNSAQHEKSLNSDLLWGLRASGYVLECFEGLHYPVPLRL